MNGALSQSNSTRAEDTALQRCNRSAIPGAKTEARPAVTTTAARAFSLRDWHQSAKPSRHDAAISPTGCLPQLANANQVKFQLPLNQDIRSCFARRTITPMPP